MRSVSLAMAVLAMLFSFRATAQVPVEDVPFIVSPDNVTLEMLRIADVKAGDHVIDLGSGDGRIVLLAARRFGATGLGVEIDPDLVRRSNASAQQAGVAARVAFRVEDLFTTDLSAATVVTMYLLPEFNLRLRPALLALRPGTRIVSHDWDMGDWAPDRTTQVDVPNKEVGREKFSRIHLWTVPARVHGEWCGRGALQGNTLRIAQRYQRFEGTLAPPAGERPPVAGRIDGAALRADAFADTGAAPLVLHAVDDRLEMQPPAAGRFERAGASGC